MRLCLQCDCMYKYSQLATTEWHDCPHLAAFPALHVDHGSCLPVETMRGGKRSPYPVAYVRPCSSGHYLVPVLLHRVCHASAQDPSYLELVKLYASNLSALEHAFGHAWYKLMTRDMGPVTRCLGSKVRGVCSGLQHVCVCVWMSARLVTSSCRAVQGWRASCAPTIAI